MPYQPLYSFHLLEKYPQITLIHQRLADGTLWATSGRSVVFSNGKGRWNQFGNFPFRIPRDLFAFSRPTTRATRADKCNLYINSLGRVIGIRAGIVYSIEKNQPFKPLFPIQGDCVLHRSICEDSLGWTYFGEYFMNPDRRPVRIWRISPDLKRWEVAHEFSPAQVRHVHGVYADPYENGAFWVTVGDLEGECFLLKTTNRFQSFQQFGDGSQDFRAVNLFFTSHSICWLTDSNLKINHAFRLDRKSSRVEKGQELDASVWYGCSTREGVFLSFTTIERGPAIRSQSSAILVSEDAFHWQKVYEFKKDFYRPFQLFKYGVISCPVGEMSLNDIYLSGEGLVGLDGCSLRASIERK